MDQDCDGEDPTDLDGDGYDGGPGGNDCDDNNSSIHPGAEENCDDGLDGDCDGLGDAVDPDCSDGNDHGCSCEEATTSSTSSPLLLVLLVAMLAVFRKNAGG